MLPITPSGKSLLYILPKALIFINNKNYLIKILIFERASLYNIGNNQRFYVNLDKGDFMEEQPQKECKVKKCCAKCIIIVIVCSLVCFFLGYYAGTKSLAKVSGAAINRPFNPRNIPGVPPKVPKIPNIPKVQNPRIQRPSIPNVPNVQKPPVTQQSQNITNTSGITTTKADNKSTPKK